MLAGATYTATVSEIFDKKRVMKNTKQVVMSKNTLQLVKKLETEYARLRARDKAGLGSCIDRRCQLEMDLLKSVRNDVGERET